MMLFEKKAAFQSVRCCLSSYLAVLLEFHILLIRSAHLHGTKYNGLHMFECIISPTISF